MIRATFYFGAVLVTCTSLGACRTSWYDISLTPDGAVMEREISQYFGPEELERVALLYGKEIDEAVLAKFEKNASVATALSGRFRTHMPGDSRNSGVLLNCDSPLGSASIYTERFGGRSDIARMFRDQERAFHILWDIGLLLLDDLVGSAPDYPALRSFLDTTVRADAWDLTLEITVSDLGRDSMTNLSWGYDSLDALEPMFIRAVHFLEGRGYIQLDEFLLEMAEPDKGDEDSKFVIALIGESIGRRMELREGTAMPTAFAALLKYPQAELENRVEHFFDNNESVASLLAGNRQQADGMHMADPSASMTLLGEQAFLFDFDFLSTGAARRVRLHIPVEPNETNGAWVEAAETVDEEVVADELIVLGHQRSYVEWIYPLADADPRSGNLPQVVFASWAEPAEQYQLDHFGRLVLEKTNLVDQCHWRKSLDTSLRAEWDAFIESSRPGPGLEATLRDFRFSVDVEPEQSDDPNAVRSGIASKFTRHLADAVRPK